jgi:hypothetical protein
MDIPSRMLVGILSSQCASCLRVIDGMYKRMYGKGILHHHVIDDVIKVFVCPINVVAGLRQQGNNNITVLSVGRGSRFEDVEYSQTEAVTEVSVGHGIIAEARFVVVLHLQDPERSAACSPGTSRGRRHYQCFDEVGVDRSYGIFLPMRLLYTQICSNKKYG